MALDLYLLLVLALSSYYCYEAMRFVQLKGKGCFKDLNCDLEVPLSALIMVRYRTQAQSPQKPASFRFEEHRLLLEIMLRD